MMEREKYHIKKIIKQVCQRLTNDEILLQGILKKQQKKKYNITLRTSHDNNSPDNNCCLQDTSPELNAATVWKEDEIMMKETIEDLTKKTTENLMNILEMTELWIYGRYRYGSNGDMNWQKYQGSAYDAEN